MKPLTLLLILLILFGFAQVIQAEVPKLINYQGKLIIPQRAPLDSTCHLQWDDGVAVGYFDSWHVGDQQAIYYNPATMCTNCPQVYSFKLTSVTGAFYDFGQVGTVDVIFHIYDAPFDTCSGPGDEIYSFPATITSFYPQIASEPLPDLLCLTGDFFLAVEYNSATTDSIPCLLMTDQNPQHCVMFNHFDNTQPYWREWYDFFAQPPPGYLMLQADGICNPLSGDANCDFLVDIGDVIILINYLYKNGPESCILVAGDVNNDGNVDVGDVVYLINYLFKSGPTPSC